MKLRVIDNVSEQEWQDAADKCEYATFFNTPYWYKVHINTYSNNKLVVKKIIFADNKCAIFPVLEKKTANGLIKSYISSAAGCYGGWVSPDKLSLAQMQEMTKWILNYFPNIYWRLNPLVPRMPISGNCRIASDSTEVLNLNNFNNEKSLLRNYSYNVRKQINKATKAGITVKESTHWNDWDKFFLIYQTALKRWGGKASNNYPLIFFNNLFNLQISKVKLWLIVINGEIIGGNLNFYQKHHCVEWHAAFNSDFFKLGSRNFLVHAIITHALKNCYSFYDFNPSGGHEGTRKFKQTFGTVNLEAPILTKRNFPGQLYYLYNRFLKR